MGRVLVFLEEVGSEFSAEVIVSSRRHVHRAKDLFVLDIAAGEGQHLGAEPEFADGPDHGIVLEPPVVILNGCVVAVDKLRAVNLSVLDVEQPDRALVILEGKHAFGAFRHEVDLAGRKVGHIRLARGAETVTLLGFLAVSMELEGISCAFDLEIQLEAISPGQPLAKPFSVRADLVIINRQTAREDDLVEPVEGGAAEAELLALGRQGGGGREGRNGQDDVVVRINITVEAELPSLWIKALVLHVQIAAARFLVGENFTPGPAHGVEHATLAESPVESLVAVILDGQGFVLEEGKILDVRRIREVDQDTDLLA